MCDLIDTLGQNGSKIEYLRVGGHHDGDLMFGADRSMDVKSEDFIALLTNHVVAAGAYISLDTCHMNACIDSLIANLSFQGSNVTVGYTEGVNASLPGTSRYIRWWPGKGTTYRMNRIDDTGWWVKQKLH
ncbi:hypothetical protein MLD52_22500 [Puniceicoccaceae bacterium K14]|nr:hypothetical protein [Puniceicoccaceae bacterium K14]